MNRVDSDNCSAVKHLDPTRHTGIARFETCLFSTSEMMAPMKSLPLILSGLLGATVFVQADIPIEIETGPHARPSSLVTFALPNNAPSDAAYLLRDAEGHGIETQRSADQPHLLMWIEPARAANTKQRYTLILTGKLTETNIQTTDKSITLGAGKNLTYHTAVVNPPKGIKPIYRRSGFVHPLRTPSGAIVTDDFPPDHAHQHGMFMAWTSGHYQGKPADLWNQVKDHGRIEHVETLHAARGPVFDELIVRLRHIVTRDGKDTPVIEERWHLIVHRRDDLTVIDFISTQHALTDAKFQVKKYHYGGFAMRGRRDWLGQGAMLNAEGLDRKAGNHAPTRAGSTCTAPPRTSMRAWRC